MVATFPAPARRLIRGDSYHTGQYRKSHRLKWAGSHMPAGGPWPMTMVGWVWLESILSSGQTMYFLGFSHSEGRTGHGDIGIGFANLSGIPKLRIGIVDGSNISGSVSSTRAVQRYKWYHCAIISHSFNLREVYVDGKFEGSNTTGLDQADWDSDQTMVGGIRAADVWIGAALYPAMYNRILTLGELQQLARGTHPMALGPTLCVPNLSPVVEYEDDLVTQDRYLWDTSQKLVTHAHWPPALEKWEPHRGLAPVIDQEGYRWRDDDDDEINATWLQDQDVDITRAKGTNTRLRVLMDTTGNTPNLQDTLQYRKAGDPDSEWRAIP